VKRPRTVFGRRKVKIGEEEYRFELTATGLAIRRKYARSATHANFSELLANISGRKVEVGGVSYVVQMDPAGVLVHGPHGPAAVSFADLVACADGQRLLVLPPPVTGCKFCEDDNKAQCGHT
jgi:hypothetical protein